MFKLLLSCALLFALAAAASAQRRGSDNSSPLIPGTEAPRPGSPEEELMHRAAIEREKEAFKDLVDRAKENAKLSAEVSSSFEQNKALTGDDLKKLERMEKLARKIRSGAGGSDDDEPLKDPPQDTAGAVKMLAEVSDDLLKKVEKTSRFVTSASVVKRSNELIELTRHVRKLSGR
jgi:SMC interacting uncharacterized protein involved in chromosome segregation